MEDDTPLVSVPIKNSETAVLLWQSDFDDLLDKGLSPRWRLSQGQIFEEGTRVSVTRLVADAQAMQKVSLIDHNPLNLKRSNLAVRPGNGGFNTKQKFLTEDRPHRLNPITIDHQYIQPKVLQQL